MAMAAAAIDRLIDSSSDPGMDKDPNSHRPRPLYRYHSYTPASTQPRSPSPSSFSPSPYVVNFKGRRAPPPPLDSKFRDPGPSEQQQGKSSSWKPVALEKSFESQDGSFKQRKNGCYQDDIVAKSLNDKHSLGASEGKGKLAADEHSTPSYSRKLSQSSSGYGEEFFDAPESPFGGSGCDETSSQSECNLLEDSELQAAEEIARGEDDAARCRKAEEALEIVLQKLAAGGLALPPTLLERGKSPVEEVQELDIAGQLLIKRMVEAAVARGAARAEVEENLEAELESKSREVIRLRDKVRYNELVNREMSQRNQEAIEMARNKRRARQRKIRWAVASASAAVAIGLSGALLYKYGPLHEFQLWKTKPEASGKDSA